MFKNFLNITTPVTLTSSIGGLSLLEQFPLKNDRHLLGVEVTDNRKFLRQVFRDAKRLMSEKYANIDFIFSKP